MTRLGILGYGAMGHIIERLAPEVGLDVAAIFDIDRPFTSFAAQDLDVVIDFTLPHVVAENVRTACEAHVNMVIGTTGWYDRLHDVSHMANEAGIGIVYGTNFSVGVQMFFRLVRLAAQLTDAQTDYDVMVHEWHHHRKQDAPSGTALTAARIVLDEVHRKERIESETMHDRIDPSALHVTSTRGGEIVGRHVLTLDAAADRIEITHDAKNREGFARGALRAARWIAERKGVHDFTDIVTRLDDAP